MPLSPEEVRNITLHHLSISKAESCRIPPITHTQNKNPFALANNPTPTPAIPGFCSGFHKK